MNIKKDKFIKQLLEVKKEKQKKNNKHNGIRNMLEFVNNAKY